MKCPNCGAQSESTGSYCTDCGARLEATVPQAQTPPSASSPPPYGTPPYAPEQQGFLHPARAPTVKIVYLGDVLFLISAALLIGVGFQNLGSIGGGASVSFVLLGLVAIPTGLIFMAYVIMPSALQPLDRVLDLLMLVMPIVFLLWGFLGSFAGGVAINGGLLLAGGLFGLAGMGFKMGILR
ncbi:MAG: hypothetical protein ACM3L5_00790 [Candidatus Saccharibacteria bacterium]